MYGSTNKIQPDFEVVDQRMDESIRYLEHGYPSSLVRWHYHKEYELHLITETSGKAFIGDYIGNFEPNSLFLIGPNLPHNWISQIAKNEQYELRDRVINFNHSFIEECEGVLPELIPLKALWQRASYGIEFLDIKQQPQIICLFEEIAVSSGLRRLSKFLTLIELLDAHPSYKILSTSDSIHQMDEKVLNRINQAITYIFENYDCNISLEDTAEHLGMRATYFSRFFKKSTGQNFIDFVNSLRINQACEKLQHTNIAITDICFMVGFNNIANFNRRFSDIKKMTPSEYRQSSTNRFC